jgi:glycosyltransferase involved in cell wall biosynthesis
MATGDPKFTILLPVVRPPILLPFAIESVQRQVCEDFELFVVCDGAPPETVAFAQEAAARDARIRVFSFAKGQRNGEEHRHTALQEARGRYVCHIGDDDLWFPDHLVQMERLLLEVEFGNVLQMMLDASGESLVLLADLADPIVQQRMLRKRWNFFGPTVAGYRMEPYRRLPVGWSPAPDEIWSDLAMWRKFLALTGCIAGTRFVVTSLKFPTSAREDWSLERRHEEISRYAELTLAPDFRSELIQRALRHPARLLRGKKSDPALGCFPAASMQVDRTEIQPGQEGLEANLKR